MREPRPFAAGEIVQAARTKNIPVAGDIELFAWHVRANTNSKVIAITGTNGKSTVTALTGHLLRSAAIDCEVAGNIARRARRAQAKRRKPPAAWVLELSSYQLETTWSLEPTRRRC
jgi:UDP-N-acetylmuramoylalanine--D-glutamate ligase